MGFDFPTPPGWDQTKTPTPEPEVETISDDPESPPTFGDNLSEPELKQAIRDYSAWCIQYYDDISSVDMSDVRIEISHKMKRAAGKAGGTKGPSGFVDDLRMKFAWKAYQKWGWNGDFRGTIRHELIHIWQYQTQGAGSHGSDFKWKAGKVDAPRHCPQFTDYKFELFCEGCDKFAGGRHKRSKIVKQAGRYRSNCCNAPLRVE